jgi:hypothetical protein
MISEHTFAGWMGVFEQRLGKPLDELAFGAYFGALRDKFRDDAEFSAAAQRVFEKHAWNTWPAPIEFESAAADLRRLPDAEVRATLRAIDASRRLAPPRTHARDAVLEEFGDDWRAQLAHCAPTSHRRLADRPAGDDPWLTDERRLALTAGAP